MLHGKIIPQLSIDEQNKDTMLTLHAIYSSDVAAHLYTCKPLFSHAPDA